MYSKQIVKNCANASFIRKMFEKGLELAKQYAQRMSMTSPSVTLLLNPQ